MKTIVLTDEEVRTVLRILENSGEACLAVKVRDQLNKKKEVVFPPPSSTRIARGV